MHREVKGLQRNYKSRGVKIACFNAENSLKTPELFFFFFMGGGGEGSEERGVVPCHLDPTHWVPGTCNYELSLWSPRGLASLSLEVMLSVWSLFIRQLRCIYRFKFMWHYIDLLIHRSVDPCIHLARYMGTFWTYSQISISDVMFSFDLCRLLVTSSMLRVRVCRRASFSVQPSGRPWANSASLAHQRGDC